MIETSIYVGDLRSHVGSRRDIHVEIPGESFYSSLCKVIDDITCDFTSESISNGIVVHGICQGNFSAQCSYGLVEIVEPFSVNVNELFEEKRARDIVDGDEDTYQFRGEDLDIEQMLRDSVIPSLPLAPVCSHGPQDCVVCSSQIVPFISKDLDKISDKIIGGIDDAIAPDSVDSRWSALESFKDQQEP